MYIPNNLNAPHQNFTNSLLIDYRYFDAKNITPRYEFGFGLSYTNFTYSDLRIRKVNAGPYVPFSGMTLPATSNERLGNASDYTFPPGFHRVKQFIYPYLNSTSQPGLDGKGQNGPAMAYNTSAQPVSPAGGASGGNPGEFIFTLSLPSARAD